MLVAFSLLTSAATAHAECARVLWTYQVHVGGAEEWEAAEGYETVRSCNAVALVKLQPVDGAAIGMPGVEQVVDAGTVVL